MKKILLLTDGLGGGGAEKAMLTLAEAFINRGDQVTIVSLRELCDYLIPQGVEYLVLRDPQNKKKGLARLYQRLTNIPRHVALLEKALSGRHFDLIFSCLHFADQIVAATPSLKKAWFWIQESLLEGRLGNKKGLRRWRKKRQLRQIYNCRYLITVSEGIARDFPTLGIVPAQHKTIYNPIPIKKIRERLQESCSYEGTPFLLHVGRFHYQKRHDRLFAAFAQTHFSRSGGKLILLGDGAPSEKATIDELINHYQLQGQVVLEGFLSNPYPYMKAAQALVVSSDYEGLPTVLIEALACGTQVISTNCPYGPEEILRGELAQGLSPLGSEEKENQKALSATIDKILADPITIQPEILAPFDFEAIIDAYEKLKN